MADFGEQKPIYLNDTHPENLKVLDKLTEPRNWNYEDFKQVITSLALTRQYVPARNRPDSIHIQGLRPCLDNLFDLAKKHGVEIAQPIFSDIEKRDFTLGRTTKGVGNDSKHSVRLDTRRQPGREFKQRLSLSAHIHPEGTEGLGNGLGLSDQDFLILLSDPNQIGMIMRVGKTLFMALKTSVTPNNMKAKSVERQIQQAKTDYIDRNTKTDLERLTDFNKAVCAEFGMVLFMATEQSRDLMERVNVVN
jgi:hypothetical protein